MPATPADIQVRMSSCLVVSVRLTVDVQASMVDEYKERENRLRRMAQRQRLQLVKSRRRDPRASDFRGYMLVAIDNNTAVYGAHPFAFNANLDDIEQYLSQPLCGYEDDRE
jgi:muconolactone delta-isomerase